MVITKISNIMKKSLLTIVLLFLMIGVTISQNGKMKQRPSIGLGIGVLSFNGDVGSGFDLSSFSRVKTGFNLNVEQRIGKYIGVAFNGTYGKLSDSQRDKNVNLNFQTKVIQGDLNFVINFDNDMLLERNSAFAPYLSVGIGYLKFDSYGDLKDKNGIPYNYWTDGTIRDKPQSDPAAASSKIIQRDYTYETQLKDSVTNYKRNTITIPIGAGLKFKVNEKISLNVGATYNLTMTDWIDNIKRGGNDNYVFANVSVHYCFSQPYDDSEERYKGVDFSSIDKTDSDGDGVTDENDNCSATPKGVKIDGHGCPIDGDEDGIPDYRDKEPLTKIGAMVDENGVTITDKIIAEKNKADTLATERSQVFNENPSLGFLKDVEAKSAEARKNAPNTASKIPAALKPADKNNDGFITTDEISAAIDAFFDGDSVFTVEKLNDLIDYFFEQ
jgi:opacity protein-like surface antigen